MSLGTCDVNNFIYVNYRRMTVIAWNSVIISSDKNF